jgi:hypothetical protein
MDVHIVVPLALFGCLTYAFKAVLDAALRYRLTRAVGSAEVMRTILDAEENHRQATALRWGIVATSLALGFALIKALDWNDISAGVIAILAAAIGLGNLLFFAIVRRVYAHAR